MGKIVNRDEKDFKIYVVVREYCSVYLLGHSLF